MPRGVTKGREYWEACIAEQKASGLTQREFAEQHGLSFWTLNRWARRLKEEGASAVRPSSSDGASPGLDEVLVAAAKKHGFLQTTPVARALGVRRLKALKYLKWLVEEGRLKVVGEYKQRRYLPIEED